MMARVRGLDISNDNVKTRLQFLKKLMNLEEYSKMRVCHLSGGSKRKLCCIMALVTIPRLLLMDEVSNGVDPMARKNLYTYLRTLKNTSVILITHRIDEAEKISDRVAIMSRGRFLDIDSPIRLKEKHGSLFFFQVDLHRAEHLEAVHSKIIQACPFCKRVYAAKGKKVEANTIIMYSFDELGRYNRIDRSSVKNNRLESGAGSLLDPATKEVKIKVVYILKFLQDLVT